MNSITNTGGANSHTRSRLKFGESNYSYETSTGGNSGAVSNITRDTHIISRYSPTAGELSAGFSVYVQGKCTPSDSGSPFVNMRYMEIWGC